MLSVTVRTSRELPIRSVLLISTLVNFNLAYLGFTVLKHFVAYGVEGVLRYSESQAINDRLYEVSHKFSEVIADWPNRKPFPSTNALSGVRWSNYPERASVFAVYSASSI